jgi:hypothetical protein
VVPGGEEEPEADVVQDRADLLWEEVDVRAERLEQVGGAGLRGGGAVAVLRDRAAGARDHERRGRRDVEGQRAATGADDVDEVLADGRDLGGVGAHRGGEAGDLVRGLALGAQRDEEAGDLDVRGVAGHDLVEDPLGLLELEVPSGRDPFDRGREHGVRHTVRRG